MLKEVNVCPKCGKKEFVKAGFSAAGTQRYLCKKCGKYFSLNSIRRRYSKKTKAKARIMFRKGMTTRQIAKELGCSKSSVAVWKNELKENKIINNKELNYDNVLKLMKKCMLHDINEISQSTKIIPVIGIETNVIFSAKKIKKHKDEIIHFLNIFDKAHKIDDDSIRDYLITDTLVMMAIAIGRAEYIKHSDDPSIPVPSYRILDTEKEIKKICYRDFDNYINEYIKNNMED